MNVGAASFGYIYLIFGHHQLFDDDDVGQQEDARHVLQQYTGGPHHAEPVLFGWWIAKWIGEGDFAQLFDGDACMNE